MDIPDAHCHVDLLAKEVGNSHIVDELGPTVAVTNDWPSYLVSAQLIGRKRRLFLSMGLHPRRALQQARDLPLLLEGIDRTRFIGEIGLDLSPRTGASFRKSQEIIFDSILEACEGKDKVINVHSTGAEAKVVGILGSYDVRNVVMHWYSGGVKPLVKAIEKGWYFSIPPAIVKSKSLRKVAGRVPDDRTLLESDAPFGLRTGTTVRRNLEITASFVSKIRRVPIDDLVATVTKNFARLTREQHSDGLTQSTLHGIEA